MLPHLEKGLNAEYEENNLQSVLIVHAEDENTRKNPAQCALLPHMHFITTECKTVPEFQLLIFLSCVYRHWKYIRVSSGYQGRHIKLIWHHPPPLSLAVKIRLHSRGYSSHASAGIRWDAASHCQSRHDTKSKLCQHSTKVWQETVGQIVLSWLNFLEQSFLKAGLKATRSYLLQKEMSHIPLGSLGWTL